MIVTVDVITLSPSIPTPLLAGSARVSPAPTVLGASQPPATIKASGVYNLPTVASSLSVISPAVKTGARVTASPISLAGVIPAPSVRIHISTAIAPRSISVTSNSPEVLVTLPISGWAVSCPVAYTTSPFAPLQPFTSSDLRPSYTISPWRVL